MLVVAVRSIQLFLLHLTFYTFSEIAQASGGGNQSNLSAPDGAEDLQDERPNLQENSDSEDDHPAEENLQEDITKLTGRQKKLFELRLKMVGFWCDSRL